MFEMLVLIGRRRLYGFLGTLGISRRGRECDWGLIGGKGPGRGVEVPPLICESQDQLIFAIQAMGKENKLTDVLLSSFLRSSKFPLWLPLWLPGYVFLCP